MHRIFTCLFGAVLFCLMFTALALAQGGQFATLRGTVTDPNGNVVPNATLTATNVATGVPRSTVSTGNGDYVIPNLPPGSYDVKVTAGSFAPREIKGIKLNLGAQQDLNIQLALPGAKENVEVSAQARLIETTK